MLNINELKAGDLIRCDANQGWLKKDETFKVIKINFSDNEISIGLHRFLSFDFAQKNFTNLSVGDPSSIAPELWNAYKDVLNDEALEALKEVILNIDDHKNIDFNDGPNINVAFYWAMTKEGEEFWCDVYTGKYNKKEPETEVQPVVKYMVRYDDDEGTTYHTYKNLENAKRICKIYKEEFPEDKITLYEVKEIDYE